jgi:hypothetical protein
VQPEDESKLITEKKTPKKVAPKGRPKEKHKAGQFVKKQGKSPPPPKKVDASVIVLSSDE